MGQIMKKIRVDLYFFLFDVFLQRNLQNHSERIKTEEKTGFSLAVQTGALVPAVLLAVQTRALVPAVQTGALVPAVLLAVQTGALVPAVLLAVQTGALVPAVLLAV